MGLGDQKTGPSTSRVVAATGGRPMTDPSPRSTGAPAGAAVNGALLLPRPGQPLLTVPVDRELLIGRDDVCDVVLRSAQVSRRHAHVWPSDGGVAVEDLGSRNGTRLNGQVVTSPSWLHDGDTLALADIELRFRSLGGTAVLPVPRQLNATGPDASRGRTQPVEPADPSPPVGSAGAVRPVARAVLESQVGTAISQAIGTGLAGTYAFAAITPLLGTVFALRRDGKVRLAAVALVTAIAVAVTVAGVTAADLTLGRSVFPWSSSGRTFIPPPDEGTAGARRVVMPKLTGESNVAAFQLLVRYGFHPQNVLFVNERSSQELFGKVVRTDPAAGTKVPDDAIVRIFVGTGSGP